MSTSDRLLNAADALVTALAAALAPAKDGDGNPIPDSGGTVAWQDNPVEPLSDAALADTLVWVVDVSERTETMKIGGVAVPVETYELLVIVQRRLPSDIAAADRLAFCRQMSGVVATIRRLCRTLVLQVDSDSGDGAVCIETDRETARNFEAYADDRTFRAGISTRWRATFDD